MRAAVRTGCWTTPLPPNNDRRVKTAKRLEQLPALPAAGRPAGLAAGPPADRFAPVSLELYWVFEVPSAAAPARRVAGPLTMKGGN